MQRVVESGSTSVVIENKGEKRSVKGARERSLVGMT